MEKERGFRAPAVPFVHSETATEVKKKPVCWWKGLNIPTKSHINPSLYLLKWGQVISYCNYNDEQEMNQFGVEG